MNRKLKLGFFHKEVGIDMGKALQGLLRLGFVAIAVFMAMISSFRVDNAAAFDTCNTCYGDGGCPGGSTKCCTVTLEGTTWTCYKQC